MELREEMMCVCVCHVCSMTWDACEKEIRMIRITCSLWIKRQTDGEVDRCSYMDTVNQDNIHLHS